MLSFFLSGFQMGYDMGLGGCWLAANCYAAFSLVLSTYLCIIPAYLHTYVPLYLMYDSSLYWLLNYLRRSSNLLSYLPTKELPYVLTYIPMYQCTNVPTYQCTYIPTYLYYLRTFFGTIYVPMYSTCLPLYLCAYIPITYDSLLYWLLKYLHGSSNLLTYLLTYVHTYVTSHVPTYQRTFIPL